MPHHQRRHQYWAADASLPNCSSSSSRVAAAAKNIKKYQTSCGSICPNSMKAHERGIQAITWPWLCPKSPRTPAMAALGPGPMIGSPSPSPFPSSISTLTAAARRAISDLFPELMGSCSCLEAQSKSRDGAIPKVEDLEFAAPSVYEITGSCELERVAMRWPWSRSIGPIARLPGEEQSQSELSIATGLLRSGEKGEAPHEYVKRDVSLNSYSPTPYLILSDPALYTAIPTHPFKVEPTPLSSDLINLGLEEEVQFSS